MAIKIAGTTVINNSRNLENVTTINGTNVTDFLTTANLDISTESLADLSDVSATTPTTGQVLKWNGSAWEAAADSEGSTINSVNDITDVTITSVSSGEILAWNGSAWVNNTLSITESQISDFGTYETADATILKDADIGVNVQAYDANLVSDATYVATENDFTTVLKNKLDGITAGAGVYVSSDFTHDDLTGYVANEHIDWTASSAGAIHLTNLPATALTSVQTAVSEVAMLALTTQEGDVVVRSDESQTYMHNGGSAGTMADFTLLSSPTDAVTSVDGATGVVTLNHDTLTGYVANEHIDWTVTGNTIHADNYTNTTYTDLNEFTNTPGYIADIVSDTTPQLGGHFDTNGFDIVSVSNANIDIIPHGSGKINLDGNGSTFGVSISDGLVELRTGSGNVAAIDLYCEINNSHKVSIKSAPHSSYSGDVLFQLPGSNGTDGQVLTVDGSGVTSWADAAGGLGSQTATLATVTETSIATFAHADYDGVKAFVSVVEGTARHVTEILITHDGTTAYATEYGTVSTGSSLASFDVDISGTDIRILATGADATSKVYLVTFTAI
jgi:hypothetical protein